MPKQIQLTQGKFAIVCDCHAHLVENKKWLAHYNKTTSSYYAERAPTLIESAIKGNRNGIKMHAVINNTPDGFVTDHINGDTLDNRCCNLRSATQTENRRNRKMNKNNTSSYKGVSYHKQNRKWQSQIQVNRKIIYLGKFDNPEDAARAYDNAAREYYGEFAKTNF